MSRSTPFSDSHIPVKGGHILSILSCAVGLLLLGCDSRGDRTGNSGEPGLHPAVHQLRLNDGATSPEVLVSRAITALNSNDTAALGRLLVTRDEFDRYLYPEYGLHYPAARDTGALARGFIWENQSRSTLKGLKKALRDYSGRQMDLVSVSFREEEKRFNSYTIHEGTLVRVRLANGAESEIHIIGSIIEMDGVCKLLSYRDTD